MGDGSQKCADAAKAMNIPEQDVRAPLWPAQLKAIAPPKLMSPFHGTVAGGMLPTEQTNEITVTDSHQNFAINGWSIRKSAPQEPVWAPGG
jgi:hypothetical protein